jgi:hypothetical protein
MSWSLERRDNEWLVLNEDGSSAGSHASRTDAIKHQRRLYATEARVASMYADLDSHTEPFVEKPVPPDISPLSLELVSMIARAAEEKALVASAAQAREEQQRAEIQEERQALVAALGRMGSPVINLPEMKAPDVTVNVPAAEVNFSVPAPEVTVNVPPAEVTVHSPDVNVTVEAPPPVQKTVTFERDPLTQQVTKAEVVES